MALEIYIEDDFEHEAEAKQAADLCSRLSALIQKNKCSLTKNAAMVNLGAAANCAFEAVFQAV